MIEVVRGSVASAVIEVQMVVGTEDPVPVDLSQASAVEFRMFPRAEAGVDPYISKTLAGGGVTLPNGGTDGVMRVAFTASDTSSRNPGEYKWQVAYTLVSGERILTRADTFAVLEAGDFA